MVLGEKEPDSCVEIGISSILGTRREQQDTVLGFCGKDSSIAAVCDGMGGLEMGAAASQLAAEMLLRDFKEFTKEAEEVPSFLEEEFYEIDEAVYNLRDRDGYLADAGTTAVVAVILENKMYWASAGDSRMLFIRSGEAVTVTREHNYQLSLDILKKRNRITDEMYERESRKGEALISYLGIGDLSLVDGNKSPIFLRDGDRILLCSDGLYKLVSSQEICEVVGQYENVQDAACALTDCAEEKRVRNQDNTSVVLLQYKK